MAKDINLLLKDRPVLSNLIKLGLLLFMVVVIAWLYPHHDIAFRQRMEVGKPWAYGLITAPFDFPVYKSDAQIMEERREVKAAFSPYFTLLPDVAAVQIAAIKQEAKDVLSAADKRYIDTSLRNIYKQGIMSVSDMYAISAEGYTSVSVVNSSHIAVVCPLSSCYTPKTAYDALLEGSPEGEMTMLNRLPLNNMLLPNMRFDTLLTNARLNERFDDLTPYSGMVQQGEKIVDKGEIVTEDIARVLDSLRRTEEERGLDKGQAAWSLTGTLVLVCLFVMLMTFYLFVFRPKVFREMHSWFFFTILITSIVATACLVVRHTDLSIYIVPFAWVPIITRVFYDSRTALYMHIITVLICSMMAPAPFEFLILQLAVGMVAVSSLRDMAQRSQLVQTAGFVLLTYCLCYTAIILAEKGSPDMLHWHIYVYFLANALLVVFSYGLIYLFERVFSLVSSITLVELTNVNSDFMLSFAEKAPGTFQHSLQVSNLAMEAAKIVGANALLVRTGALYHDIGKLEAPQNFTENQQGGAENPLMEMSPEEAAQTVIAHVSAGLRLAERNRLPGVIMDFIRTHHGTSKVRFFYNTWCNQHPDAQPDDALFTYPGPTPHTKETAILMMADAVEARSRSLSEITEESISRMVDDMISTQMAEGQFERTPLTFRDLDDIKKVFTTKLISMNHHRIAYPVIRN